ncbi:hypothetical protein F4810DRAFT_714013 [Camillea tinctor]|nr:hypothetical protein F4810DRAFT_714013 [Camillea tinctor]
MLWLCSLSACLYLSSSRSLSDSRPCICHCGLAAPGGRADGRSTAAENTVSASDVPQRCLATCQYTIDLSSRCDRSTDGDDAYRACVCTLESRGRIAECAACAWGVDDDNDVLDLLDDCRWRGWWWDWWRSASATTASPTPVPTTTDATNTGATTSSAPTTTAGAADSSSAVGIETATATTASTAAETAPAETAAAAPMAAAAMGSLVIPLAVGLAALL